MERKSSYSTAYKYKGTISEEDKKSQRIKRRSVEQRDLRQTLVNKRRNLEDLSPVQEGASVLSDKSYKDKTPVRPKDGKPKIGQAEKRLEQLKKWKAEREEQKKKELVKQKPAFKVRKMSHQDVGLYKKDSAAKTVIKPIDKPLLVKKVQTKTAPDPPKVKRLNKPVVAKSYEKPTIGFMSRQGGDPKAGPSSSRQTRSHNKGAQNKKPQPPTVNHPTKGTRSTRQTHGKDTVQTTSKVTQVSTASDLNLTKVSTSRGERESTYSFAPDEFTFNAASFVFNPLSPNSAQNFLNPGQETFVSFLDHNPKISSTPNNQKRKGRSSVRRSETKDSTMRESPKSDTTMMSTEKPTEAAVTETTDNAVAADSQVKVDKVNDMTGDTVTSEHVDISDQKVVERANDTFKEETPLRRSSRRSVLSKVVHEEKSDNDNDVEKKPSTPVQSASRRSRRSVPSASISDNMVTKSGRKTRRSLSTIVKDGDVTIEKSTRRSTRKSVIISTECEVIPETVTEAEEEDSVFTDENVDAEKGNNDEQQVSKVDNVKTAALFNIDISNNDAGKKDTPGRRGAKTRNKSFAGFRLPDAHSVPLSASAKRKRRKTVMPKSPEEWVELLSKSPMVEMTRRTPKLNSSLPTIDFSDIDLSSPHLCKDTKEKERALSDPTDTISDLSVMPSDPKLNLFQALADSENLSSDKKEDNQKKDDSTQQKTLPMETDSKESVEGMVIDEQEISKLKASDGSSQVHDVKYFRALLTTETNRLKVLCKQWEDVNSSNNLTEEVSGQIRTTVGQAVLLMDQRFKQFSGLVDNCEFKTGEKETTCTDLDGFWDMIYFQVEDVDNKFEKLRKLRDNNWVDSEPKPAVKKVKKKVTKPTVTKPAVKSKFAAFRAKMKKNPEVTQSPKVKVTQSTDVLVMEPPKYVIPAPEEEKVVKMGVFFRVASPVKSPRPHCEGGTPKKSASQSQVKPDEEKQEESNIQADKSTSDKPTSDKPVEALSVPNSGELLMRRTPHRKSYAPVIPSPLLVDSTPQPRPVRSCTKKTPLSRQLLNYEIDINMDTSVNKENNETSAPNQSERSSAKKRRRSARKSVNFNDAVLSPKPDSTTDGMIADTSTDVVDPANISEEKFVDDDIFAKYLQPMSVLHGNSEKENSPRSPKRRRTSSGLKACPSSNKRKSSVNKKVHFNSTACEDISGATMRRTPLPERRMTRRSLSQTTENENYFDFGLVQNSPQTSPTHSSRPSLLYTPPDLPNRPVRPLKEVPTATLISFTP